MNQPQTSNSPRSPLCQSGTIAAPFRLKQWFQQLWQRCLWAFSATSEPQVWQAVDRHGHAIGWQVYDPMSSQTQFFGSELEVRLWLEQQYSR
jgi:hypothetical protein